MIAFASSMVGHWAGGLGWPACGVPYSAVSGSSPATVVAIGTILLPAMVKQGSSPLAPASSRLQARSAS
jgi:C4-dicarboxylate transporter DctM subunit